MKDTKLEQKRIEAEINGLTNEKDRILKAIINENLSKEDCHSLLEKTKTDIANKEIYLNELKIDLNDIVDCIQYCKHIVTNIADLWKKSDINSKQRFQNLIFPHKISFDGKNFGNTDIALIFNVFHENKTEESKLAPRAGRC